MKSDLLKFLLIIVLAACAYGAYSYLSKDADANSQYSERLGQRSNKNFSSSAPSEVISPVATPTVVVSTVQNNEQLSSNKIPYAEYRTQYAIPLTGLAAFLKEIMEQEKNDSTGVSSFVIYKILLRCSLAPQSKRDLEEFNKGVADLVQTKGGDNGEVQRNVEHYETEFAECAEVSKLLSAGQYDHYLQKAVDRNDPVAQYIMAISIPTDYQEWDESNKQIHRIAMGKLLEKSQQQCEPLAFAALSNPAEFGEGDLWVLSTEIDIPVDVKTLGNLIALADFYANSVTGAERSYRAIKQRMYTRAKDMRVYEIELAKQYGSDLYKKYCLNQH